ncbi:MAG: T9SS type A sorting domain-containing protein, partial [Flavobacteriales bacterium]
INGVTYTSSNNTATHTLTNSAGCDSIVTLNLTIFAGPAITTQPDNTNVIVGNNAQFQISVAGIGNSYQWQQNGGTGFNNISNFGIYSGVNTNTLTITGVTSSIQQNGYRCIVTSSSGCSDTTTAGILNISLTGIEEIANQNALIIYPNPTTSVLNIKSSIAYKRGRVINGLGQIVLEFGNVTTFDVSFVAAGTYTLLFYSESEEVLVSKKLVIQ